MSILEYSINLLPDKRLLAIHAYMASGLHPPASIGSVGTDQLMPAHPTDGVAAIFAASLPFHQLTKAFVHQLTIS